MNVLIQKLGAYFQSGDPSIPLLVCACAVFILLPVSKAIIGIYLRWERKSAPQEGAPSQSIRNTKPELHEHKDTLYYISILSLLADHSGQEATLLTDEHREAISAAISALSDDILERASDSAEQTASNTQNPSAAPDTAKPRKNIFRKNSKPISPWEY